MWFKNIETWSQKKLKGNFILYGLLYIIFALIVPVIIISCKYDLIKSRSTRLSGVGLILVVCILVFLIKGIKRLLDKLPQEEKKEQVFKFTVIMIYNLIIPIGGLILVYVIKQNVTLACDTITCCLYSMIAAIVIDSLTLKYLEVEWDLRMEAKHKLAVNKRIKTLENR